MIVTHFACKFACLSKPTKKASPASCMAITAVVWNCRSPLIPCIISLTTFWKGSHQIRSSVPLRYFLISFRAHIPLFSFPVTPSFFLSLLTSFSIPLFLHFSSLPSSFLASLHSPSLVSLALPWSGSFSFYKPCLVTKQMLFNLLIYCVDFSYCWLNLEE